MNYLTVIDRFRGTGIAAPERFLVSGCDDLLRTSILNHIIHTAAQNQKSLIILDNGNLLRSADLEGAGYQIRNGLGGEFALCDPFCINTLKGMIWFRNLLSVLGYNERQKMALIQYLNFLSHVEGLDKPEGKANLSMELFGSYSTAAQVEARLQYLMEAGLISPQQQIHLLTKYAEVSAEAVDFENMLYLLVSFLQGERLALDSRGLAVVYPLEGLDEDTVFCSLLTRLLKCALDDCHREKTVVVILDKGFGDRTYFTSLIGQLAEVELHLLSRDVFTLCTGEALTSLKNQFAARVYGRHASMDSCAVVEKSLGDVQVVKKSRGVQVDRRWRANSAWDMLLGNNKTETTTDNAPVWEPRYKKESIYSLRAGSAVLEIGGNSSLVSI